jgi:hypothetical protein
MNAFVVLPTQLYITLDVIELFNSFDTIFIVEDTTYFNTENCARYRACMIMYYDSLKKILNIPIKYVGYSKIKPNFLHYFKQKNNMQLHMFYPEDILKWGPDLFSYRFLGLPIKFYDSPGFLLKRSHKLPSSVTQNYSVFYKYMRQYIKHKYSLKRLKDKHLKYSPDTSDIWKESLLYAKKIVSDVNITPIPITHAAAEICTNINNIQFSLHLGLITPALLLERYHGSHKKNIYNIVFAREFERIINESKYKQLIKIKHRRYEYDSL